MTVNEAALLVMVLVITLGIATPGAVLIYHRLRLVALGEYEQMTKTYHSMSDELAEAHLAIRELRAEMTKLEAYLQVVIRAFREATGTEPPPMPASLLQVNVPASEDRPLAVALSALFDREELDDLAFQLGIGVEELTGETRSKRARSLVDYCRRHSLSNELIALARKLRPEGKL